MSRFTDYNNAHDLTEKVQERLELRPKTFVGTTEEWNALTADEKAKYELVDITDDISDNDTVLYADSPIGTILPYGGATAPNGWFLCQGQALSRTSYAELFAVIGTSFGSGDGSTTFNLPDLRGEFLRGAGTNSHSGQGNGGTVGEHQDSTNVVAFAADATEFYIGASSASDGGGTRYADAVTKAQGTGYRFIKTSYNDDNISYNKNVAVRPTNTSVNYIIKAQQVALPIDLQLEIDEKANQTDLDSLQEQVQDQTNVLGAKNFLKLLKSAGDTEEDDGVTATYNADGSVTLNGESTNNVNLCNVNVLQYLKAGKYIVSGCPKSQTSCWAYVICVRNGVRSDVFDRGDGGLLTVYGDETNITYTIYAPPNTTVDNVVFRPMIRMASDPDDTFVKPAYTNSQITDILKDRFFSNPNLLVNPWFTVNQLGLSTYPSSMVKVFDCWYQRGQTTETTIDENGITMTNLREDGATWLANHTYTLTEANRLFLNKPVTMSIMMQDGSIYSKSSETGHPDFNFTHNGVECTFNLEYNTSNGLCRPLLWIKTPQATLNIRAAKLEMGMNSTLFLDTEPNYSEELARCQRYMLVLKAMSSNGYSRFGLAVGCGDTTLEGRVHAEIPTPVTMRANPKVTTTGNIGITANGQRPIKSLKNITNVAADCISPNMVCVNLFANTISDVEVGTWYQLLGDNDTSAKIVLDANLF